MKIKFQISDPIWWGYNIEIDLDSFHNSENIIEYVLDNLNVSLTSLNLIFQAEFLEKVKKEFHIHDYSFEDILTLSEKEIVYICRHPKKLNNEDLKLQ